MDIDGLQATHTAMLDECDKGVWILHLHVAVHGHLRAFGSPSACEIQCNTKAILISCGGRYAT